MKKHTFFEKKHCAPQLLLSNHIFSKNVEILFFAGYPKQLYALRVFTCFLRGWRVVFFSKKNKKLFRLTCLVVSFVLHFLYPKTLRFTGLYGFVTGLASFFSKQI